MMKYEKEAMTDIHYVYYYVLSRVEDGERFRVNLERRTLHVGGKPFDLSTVRFTPVCEDVVLHAIEELYRDYKYSVPSERSESHRRLYFRALPEAELSDEDMTYGMQREHARCALELYILLMLLAGNLQWHEEWGSWFWQSPADKDLVLLRQWIEPSA